MILNFIKKGSGNEVLVLLHGLMESAEIWRDMLPELSKHSTIICIDLPGHGRSATISKVQTMELMAESVFETLKKENVEEFHIIGHSLGGYVALAFAKKFPEKLKSLTLFFSTFLEDTPEKKINREKSIKLIEQEYVKFVNAGTPLLFNKNELDELKPQIEFAKDIALESPKQGAIATIKGMIERESRLDVMKEFPRKILVFTGRFDNAVNYKGILEKIPNSKNIKAYVLDSGHQGHLEKPSICNAILLTELINKDLIG